MAHLSECTSFVMYSNFDCHLHIALPASALLISFTQVCIILKVMVNWSVCSLEAFEQYASVL